jgi:glycosyltransferase involved in cell wall biosynthesis
MGHARALEGQKCFLRDKAEIPPDLPVILFCGKFVEQKCPFDLLKAFVLLSEHCNASLVFVGDGPLRNAMEAFVAERQLEHVYFFGFRNQTELPACYALADVFVLPSSFEPWGLVLNEAMCFGLPVIASDQVGAAADLVRNGRNGFVYPVGNVEALAHQLQHVLADERTRQETGRQSQVIISRWGIEEDVEGVLMALHAVTDKRM